MALCEKQAQSPDKGRAFFLEFAAKQCAIARGLGYKGAYLGGHLQYDDYEKIVAQAQSYGTDDWRDFAREIHFSYPDEFYYFEKDETSALSSSEISHAYLHSQTPSERAKLRRELPSSYKLNRIVHDRLFVPESNGFQLGQKLTSALEDKPTAQKFFHTVEQASNIPIFGCRDCGDCSLPDIAYLCP